MIEQLVFILVLTAALGAALVQFNRIRRTIRLGLPEAIRGDRPRRWRNVLLVAFGQQKMFKKWKPAWLHLFIYVAFLITQIELIEIVLDGVTGSHRIFAPVLGGVYPVVINSIEVLSVLALVATIVFLLRRTLFKRPSFKKPEMKGWPGRDGLYILLGEIVLIAGIFSMNSADVLLQDIAPAEYPDTGVLYISSTLASAFLSDASQNLLTAIERMGWWLHILTVLAFLNYLPVSKHLHILLSFPNAYYTRSRSRGEMENMPEIMNEVKSMMGLSHEEDEPMSEDDLPVFGAADVCQLSWKTLLEAYTCTECGRCTEVCPANMTGKALSPRKIMMDIRDRAEEVGRLRSGKQAGAPCSDGRSLFDRITPEELHACTACQACVEACPVLINPLEPILAMRRYEVLTDSSGPSDWIPMFNAIENNGSVWQVTDSREAWINDQQS